MIQSLRDWKALFLPPFDEQASSIPPKTSRNPKSEVRVEARKVSQNPMNIGEKRSTLCVFTPDSGIEKASTKQTANGDFAQQIMPAILSSGRVQILKQYGDRAIVSGAPITRPGVLVEIEAGGNDAKNLFLRSTEQPARKPRSI